MTKKLLAMLLAALMLCTLFAGCQTEQVIWESGEYEEYEDEQTSEDEQTGEDEKEDDKGGKSTKKPKKTTSGKTTTKSRQKQTGDKALNFKPVDDPGADYKISGEVVIAVDIARVTDYNALFDVMEGLFPNLTIKYDFWTHGDEQAQEYMIKNFNSKACADVIWDDASRMPANVASQWVYPLTKFTANDPEYKYVPQNLAKSYTYEGELYAVPHQATFDCVAFNTDLLKKLGLKLPGLEWTIEEYESYLRAAAGKFSAGWCVGNRELRRQADRIAYYKGNKASPGNYNEYGYNVATNSVSAGYLEEGVSMSYKWSTMMDGTDGTALSGKQGTDGSSLLNSLLGVNTPDALWVNGKALIEDTGTYLSEKWTNLKFNWVQWPAPNTKGNVMAQVDHCFITSVCPDDTIKAAYQVLRFISFSTNGHLARLTMYEEDQRDKYALSSHVYYPTSTSPQVLKKFNSLKCVTEADKYFVKNLQNSARFDAFKYIYDFHGVNEELRNKVKAATKNPTGVNLNEVVDKTNKAFKASKEEFTKRVKAAQEKFNKTHK